MNNDASFQNAKRLYLEQYGDPMVTNTYLKIALVLVSLVAIGLALVDLRTIRTFQNFRPLVIRIDQLGRAEALDYHNFDYKPQDAEVRYFLTQFCTLYYRRNRYTIQNDFSKSLYFLDTSLANSVFDAYKKGDIIKNSLRTPPRPRSTLMSKTSRSKDCRIRPTAPAWTSTWCITRPPITARSSATSIPPTSCSFSGARFPTNSFPSTLSV